MTDSKQSKPRLYQIWILDPETGKRAYRIQHRVLAKSPSDAIYLIAKEYGFKKSRGAWRLLAEEILP